MLQINVLWTLIYFLSYGILCGIWNVIITRMVYCKSKKLANTTSGINKIINYQTVCSNNYLVKANSYLPLAPMYNVVLLLLWPIYLTMLIVSGIYYYKRYLN